MQIEQLIDRDLTALNPEDTIYKAIEMLFRHHRTGLPVVDYDNHVLGFLSEEDVITYAMPNYVSDLKSTAFLPDYGQFARRLAAVADDPVTNAMHKECFVFQAEDIDFNVASEMIRHHIKIAPVLKDGLMIGCITRAYLIKRMMENSN